MYLKLQPVICSFLCASLGSLTILIVLFSKSYSDVSISSQIGRVTRIEQASVIVPDTDGDPTNITVYIDMLKELDNYYGNSFTKMEQDFPAACPLPNNSSCILQHTDKTGADVLFRMILYYLDIQNTTQYRFCERQIVAMFNTEAEKPEMREPLEKADIRADHHIRSTITVADACGLPWGPGMYKTPDPLGRKGVALFMSNCNVEWRNKYILEVSKYIHIYSYGKCWHNVSMPDTRDDVGGTFSSVAKKHRVVITFENTINEDYISEKVVLCFQTGVIPVYKGPLEIKLWIPGDHTVINPDNFKDAKELAAYLKRIDEDDDLFRYHTTNFNYTVARKTHVENCRDEGYMCSICKDAQKMKILRRKQGLVPATCLP